MDMIELYQEILKLALFPLKVSGVILLPEGKLDPTSESEEAAGTLHIPDELFPQDCQVIRLPHDETFIESAVNTLSDISPSNLFVWPPLLSYRFLSERVKEKYHNRNLEEIAILMLANNMPPGSYLGTLMPINFFSGVRTQSTRDELFDIASPTLLITHNLSWPEMGLPFHSAFQMNTLIMEIQGEERVPMRFFKLPNLENDALNKEVLSDFDLLLKQGGGRTQFGYVIRDRNQIRGKLTHDLHHPDLTKQRQELITYGNVRPLSDIVDLYRGIHITREIDRLIETDPDNSTECVPFIEGRDIRVDGSLAFEDTRYQLLESSPDEQLRVGDIVTRAIIDPRRSHPFSVAVITSDMLPLAASNSVLILRPYHSLTDEEKAFILAYLRSEAFVQFLSAEVSGINLTIAQLEKAPVPVPDNSMKFAIKSLNQSRNQFRKWQKEAEEAQNSLFSYTSAKDNRLQILSAGRLARQRSEAGSLVEDFRYRIHTQYPHPLAYLWRKVETSRPNQEGYIQVLEAAEITLCYLACMAITLSRAIPDTRIAWLEEISKRLKNRNQGTSMGDWIAVLREARDTKSFRNLPDIAPFYEVLHLLSEDDVDQSVQRLKTNRDDQAHGRGPKGSKMISKSYKECYIDLETLFRACDFLTEYTLRYIESVRFDTIRRVAEYEFRDLLGDHPLVPIDSSESEDIELETGSLYLVDRSDKLHLLRPFLIRRECPVCGSWATFYLDTYQSDRRSINMKSMEHGHIFEDDTQLDAFRYVGILS